MIIYNTLSRKIEEFKPLNDKQVGIYICGPTVYDFAHIGHARTYVNSDVLVRTLKWLGYDTRVVMNITDVGHLTSDADTGEDKIERKAKQEKKSAKEIAGFYTKDFWQMCRSLNIQKPDVVAPVTEHISEQIELVRRIENKGFTYKTSDGIYFDTSRLEDYGKLAKLDAAGLKEGARVEKNPEKRNATDFALWKFSPKGKKRQMEWDSPWGVGFPGWHIECSAISMKYLGESFDIHTGGVDHIAVHHTNEIAQAESVTGKQFVKYWFHSGHLMIEGEKMSKSLNNFFRLVDVENRGYNPLALRYLYLTGHYRTTMNFTWEALESAASAYEKLAGCVRNYRKAKSRTVLSNEKLDKINNYRGQFIQAVENDLLMPEAVSVVWELIKSNVPDYDKYDLLMDFDQVLGLGLSSIELRKVPDEIFEKAREIDRLRSEKKFEESDNLRREIEEQGYKVKNTDQGTVINN